MVQAHYKTLLYSRNDCNLNTVPTRWRLSAVSIRKDDHCYTTDIHIELHLCEFSVNTSSSIVVVKTSPRQLGPLLPVLGTGGFSLQLGCNGSPMMKAIYTIALIRKCISELLLLWKLTITLHSDNVRKHRNFLGQETKTNIVCSKVLMNHFFLVSDLTQAFFFFFSFVESSFELFRCFVLTERFIAFLTWHCVSL